MNISKIELIDLYKRWQRNTQTVEEVVNKFGLKPAHVYQLIDMGGEYNKEYEIHCHIVEDEVVSRELIPR